MKSFKLYFVFLLLWLLAIPTMVAFAAPVGQEGPAEYTLSAILLWIASGPGASYLVGLLVAHLLENIPVWHKLPAQLKFVITLVLAGLFPVLAQLLLAWPGLAVVEPWLNIAISAIVLWLASQYQYRRIKSQSPIYGIR